MKLLLVNCLSFTAGYINALSVLCFAIPITHMTGLLTRISLFKSHLPTYSPLFYIVIVLAYLCGAILSGKCFKQGIKYLAIALFIVALIILSLVWFLYIPSLIVVTLALLSGFQNAIPLKVEQSIVRTTHFSGTLTDIGVALGRHGIMALSNQVVLLQCTSILTFILGGIFVLLLSTSPEILFIICALLYTLLSFFVYQFGEKIK